MKSDTPGWLESVKRLPRLLNTITQLAQCLDATILFFCCGFGRLCVQDPFVERTRPPERPWFMACNNGENGDRAEPLYLLWKPLLQGLFDDLKIRFRKPVWLERFGIAIIDRDEMSVYLEEP